MALLFQRGSGTSTNIDSSVPKRSITNKTAARKFSAPDTSQEQDEQDVTIKSNDEHLIEQAASVKGAAMVADQVASTARDALAATRAQVGLTIGEANSDVRPSFSSVTELDVAASRDLLAKNLAQAQQSDLIDIHATAQDIYKILPENVFQNRSFVPAPPSYNPIVPDLESVMVDMDKRKGSIDCFFATMLFTVPLEHIRDGRLEIFRIFRATVRNPIFHRGTPVLSMHGIDRLSTARNRFRSKNADTMSQISLRLKEDGIVNSISLLNPVDPTTNLRISSDSNVSINPASNSIPGSLTALSQAAVSAQSFVNAPRLDGLDASVATNLNILGNIRTQDPAVAAVSLPPSAILNLATAKKDGLLNPSQTRLPFPPGTPSIVVDGNNSQEFREIASLTVEKLKSRIIGDQVEYLYIDDTIGFGKAYRYYITTVDSDMIESGRSRMVESTVEGIRVPESPKSVVAHNVKNSIALSIQCDDQLVEKFEIFRREANPAFVTQRPIFARVMASPRGFNVDTLLSPRLDNNFIKLGESLNGSHGAGSSFYDRSVLPGQRYSYRVFSVDVFGNKSERPEEISIYVPDSSRPNDLIKPHLTSEADTVTGQVRLTFQCTDPRVRSLFLARRDLTLDQSAFTTPSQVNRIMFGNPRNAEQGLLSMEGEVLRSETKDLAWTGYFENNPRGSTVFIDKSTQVDHTYQYRIYGVDLFGNRTSDEITRPMMVTRNPLIDRPINLTTQVVQGPRSTVGGVQVTWQESNIAISAEDMLGNRSDLRNSAVRTLYQVERRKVGEERWVEFPLIEDLQLFDAAPSVLGGLSTPGFRPDSLQNNQTYVYRVKAVTTGSFSSIYASSDSVFISLPLLAPTNFRLRSSDANVQPAYIVINWDTPDGSGTVDKWEIQRAEVNNLAAARLNPKSAADFQGLSFAPFREVHHESSRFRAQTADLIRGALVPSATPSALFTGDHQFQDSQVRLGNSYFYRIRSVGLGGGVSGWVYRGMKLTDASFERKINSVIDPALRQSLSTNLVPLVIQGQALISSALRTFSFQPNFSKPVPPQVLVGADVLTLHPGGGIVPKPVVQPTYSTSTKKLTGKF